MTAYLVAMIFLIVGAINWLTVGLFRVDLVTSVFGGGMLGRLLYVLVGAAALFVIWRRDFYLPFLGKTALPCPAFEDRIPPGASRTIRLSIAAGTKVLYWAAEPAMDELKTVRDWQTAYAHFENAGVATAGSDGIAYLKVRDPQGYNVPFVGGLLQKYIAPHVHYRTCGADGMLSRVETIPITHDSIEGFENPTSSVSASMPVDLPAVSGKKEGFVKEGDIGAGNINIDLNSIGAGDLLKVLNTFQTTMSGLQ
jgi:uncharacterized membrane protein YuzA (DUF378 family)